MNWLLMNIQFIFSVQRLASVFLSLAAVDYSGRSASASVDVPWIPWDFGMNLPEMAGWAWPPPRADPLSTSCSQRLLTSCRCRRHGLNSFWSEPSTQDDKWKFRRHKHLARQLALWICQELDYTDPKRCMYA